MKQLKSLLTLCLCLLIASCGKPEVPQAEQEAMEKVVKKNVRAFNDSNVHMLKSTVVKMTPVIERRVVKYSKYVSTLKSLEFTKYSEETATAKYQIFRKSTVAPSYNENGTFDFVKVEGEWKIKSFRRDEE